jgi:hypothetical protein
MARWWVKRERWRNWQWKCRPCKIWDFHGGDYEVCRLLGYRNTVRTSQETHYVSAIEPSRLMLCKIWGFHGGDYEEWCLLGCYEVWLLWEPTFRRNIAPVFLRSVRRLLVTASVVPSSLIIVTLMKEALSSSETSVLTISTRRNIPEHTTLRNEGRCVLHHRTVNRLANSIEVWPVLEEAIHTDTQ